MPEQCFLDAYAGAVKRDCAALWHFVDQREGGHTDWLPMIAYADVLVDLGDEFIENVNRVGRERGLCDEDTPAMICPRCGRESCMGASRLMRRVLIANVMTEPEPDEEN